MDTNKIPILNSIPEPWRTWFVLAVTVSPLVTRAFYALKNQGGLKGVLCAIWLGTNTPKPQPKGTNETVN